MNVRARHGYENCRAQAKLRKKLLCIRLAGSGGIDHHWVTVCIHSTYKLFSKIQILWVKDIAALCNDQYLITLNLIIGRIRTVKMITDSRYDQIKQPVAVC